MTKKIIFLIILLISIFLLSASLWELLYGKHVDGFIPYIAISQCVLIIYCLYQLEIIKSKN